MSLVIKIDGVDKATLVKRNSIKITDQINERADTCSFVVTKYPTQSFVPSLNDDVIIELNTDRIFAGSILSISDKFTGENTLEYTIKCVDHTHNRVRHLIVERYENMTINDIIKDLIDVYATGYTYVGVNANIVIESIAFNRISISQCIKKLADTVNYNWYVDYFKDVKFFARTSDASPFNISDTSDNFIYDSLSIKQDLSQLRNKILVEGGEIEGNSRTVVYAGNTEQIEFDTQYKFSESPTVTVDGTAQTVGIDYLDDDASFDCMWNFNEKYIRFTTGNIPPAPSGITNVDITGTPLYPIIVNVPNPTSIALYGTFEHVITDKSIKSQGQAIDRAIAEIQAYASQINEGGFQTYTAGLKSGQIITINSSLRGVNEDLVIQKVSFKMLSNTTGYEGIWTITVATLKTIGIIQILQKLLLDEDLEINEQETLLTFLQFSDPITVTDAIDSITTTSITFKYNNVADDYETYYGYSTYE